jgi:flagellar hook-associated protein 1 FlgK
MSLSSALSTAVSGLQATQAELQIVSANVANAGTPGYTSKNGVLEPITTGGITTGVRVADVTRTIDTYVQRQLRTENSGLSYSSTRANYLNRIQQMLGAPGSDSSLDTLVGNFTGALDQLATSPDSQVAQSNAVSSAQTLAQSLNNLSNQVQGMRGQVNGDLQASADQVNGLLQSIADLQGRIQASSGAGQSTANLLDQQDRAIDQLSSLVDIQVSQSGVNGLTLTTNSGIQLLANGVASKLVFSGGGNVGPHSLYNSDPSKDTIGTIMVTTPAGGKTDLLGSSGAQSGTIKALADLRDNTLVQAQTQLDDLAAGIASALSSTTVSDTDGSDGYTADLSKLQAGNTLTVNYTDGFGAAQSVTLVRVDSAASLPVDPTEVPGATGKVIGVDFSGGLPGVLSQIQGALGGDFDASLSGSTLTVAAAPAGSATVTGLSSRFSVTALQGQGTAMPLFVESGGTPYTGNLDGDGQRVGFAQRITVNSAVASAPSLLVKYSSSTLSGDASRPAALRDALDNSDLTWHPDTGIGTTSDPYAGSPANFAAQILNRQGGAAAQAASIASGQQIVVNTLQDSMNKTSGVNLDDQMEKLIQLQLAYSSNARVLTTVNQMIQSLLQS